MGDYMRLLVIGAAALAVSGCATSPKKIEANYIPAATYQHLDCTQLRNEMIQVGARRDALYQRIKRRNKSDKIVTGVGVLVAWPALFFLKGNGAVRDQYALLMGQYNALSENYKAKECREVAQ
ncbi:MAG: hypothetical protein WDN44_11905 [Sphingomonas sp.]